MQNNFYDNSDFKQLLECIKSQFAGKIMLNRQQTAKLLGIGISTLDLRIAQGRDMPQYIKMGDARNSRIAFAITDIATYIFLKRVKVSTKEL